MGQQWYVRFPDREAGPYSSGELRRLAAEGSVSPDFLVSLDRQRWIKASRVRELFIQDSVPPPSPDAATGVVDESPDAATGVVDDLPDSDATATKGNIPSGFLGAAREMARRAGKSTQAEKAKVAVGNVVDSAKGLGYKARDYARSDEAKELTDRAIGLAKEVSSHAKGQAADAARRATEAAAATMPFWRTFLREMGATAIATAHFTTRLLRYGYGLARMPFLQRRAREAQIAYGQRLFEGGLGDEIIRGQIATLMDRIKSVEAAKGTTRVLKAEKRGLLLRLSDHALVEGISAVEDQAAYQGALTSLKAIEDQKRNMATARLALKPPSPAYRLRLGIGLGTSACTIVILGMALSNQQLHAPENVRHESTVGRTDIGPQATSDRARIAESKNISDPRNGRGDSSTVSIREEHDKRATVKEFTLNGSNSEPRQGRPDAGSSHRAVGLAGADPSVIEVLQPTSEVFLENGFKDYEFGKTAEDLKDRIRSDDVEDHKWVNAEDAKLLFDKEHLRGIRRTYSGDKEGYLDAVRGEFGAARDKHVMVFSRVGRNTAGETREDLVRASYYFPRTLAYVEAATRTRNTATFGLRTELQIVEVTAYDRDWVTGLFDEDMKNKRRILEAARAVVDHFNVDGFDWDAIPAYPDTKLRSMLRRGKYEVRLFLGKAAGGRNGKIKGDSLFEIQELDDGSIVMRVDCYCAPHYVPHPLLAYKSVPRGHYLLDQDILKCNSYTAQELFAPEGTTIHVHNNSKISTFESLETYSWKTNDGWTVSVEENNTFFFVRKRSKSL